MRGSRGMREEGVGTGEEDGKIKTMAEDCTRVC